MFDCACGCVWLVVIECCLMIAYSCVCLLVCAIAYFCGLFVCLFACLCVFVCVLACVYDLLCG